MKGKRTMVKLNEVLNELGNGGYVRFTWSKCGVDLILANGEIKPIDGRTYQAFLSAHQQKFARIEIGTVETKDLVIEWREINRPR
jgi:hypothetical protein